MLKKIGVVSLGCDKNTVDTECMLYYLKQSGFEIVNDCNEADVIIVNTCAFIESARKESIDTIFEMSAYKSGNLKKLIMTGCFSEKYIDEIFDELVEVDAFLGINQYPYIVQLLKLLETDQRVNGLKCFPRNENTEGRIVSTPFYYAYLKIADGCDNHCTYCTIPSIRGKFRSIPIENLVQQAKGLVLGGVKELILVAQDVTSYGIDLYGEFKIIELVKELSKIQNLEWIRLLYCYPEKLSDNLISEIVNNNKVCKYIDVPLQHISDKILKLMGRRSRKMEIEELFNKLKQNGISIRSTFIVGFAGEEESNFNELLEFLDKFKLNNAGFFTYSKEEGTPASKLPNQVLKKDKLKREKLAYKKQAEVSLFNNSKLLNSIQKVLLCGFSEEKGMFSGRTEFMSPEIDGLVYFTIENEAVFGEFYNVLITDYDEYDLMGEVR